MGTADIKSIIAGITAAERESGNLRVGLKAELRRLRAKLVLPDEAPMEALMAFIFRYIESVPSTISLVRAVSQQLGFFDYAAPFLHLAEDYFLHPPQDLAAQSGCEHLLAQAFLAHRLLEEVNDHHIRHLQRPLLPVDMTEANIIVHHLLGEAKANQLESLVASTASGLLQQEYVWERVRRLPASTVPPARLLPKEGADIGWEAKRKSDSIRLRLAC